MIRRLSFFSLIFLLASCSDLKYKTSFDRKTGEPKHARGVFINDEFIVTSGYHGVVSVSSVDPIHFTDYKIDSLEDLRDIHFVDGNILAMNSGNLGQIWKFNPDKLSKQTVFNRDSVFLDGMDFNTVNQGAAFGDPINGKLTILLSKNKGDIWYLCNPQLLPQVQEGEAGFAASGSGIKLFDDGTIYIGTGGGEIANLYTSPDFGESWKVVKTPMKSGGSYGIYSIYFWTKDEGIIIGGSYEHQHDAEKMCFITQDAGKSWTNISSGLPGYCSSINGTEDGELIFASGRNGVYYTKNKGKEWKQLWKEPFYSIAIHDKKAVFSGKNGKLRIIDIQ